MPKVVVVDDDRTLTSLVKTLLELEPDGFEVDVIPLGEEVLQAVKTDPPDIFMIDYHLKDMNGVDLIMRLRALDHLAHTPIILASGLDVEREALEVGANLFLPKPFEPGDLAETIMELIG